jgi:putative membrane protein
VLVWSGIDPKDRLTWALEVSPAVIAAAVLAYTYRSFRLTPLLYGLLLAHCIILMVGGHYTYAEVPLFDQLFKDLFGFTRNNFDKLGHIAQGLVPALVAREVLVRKNVIADSSWRDFFIVAFCLAVSAFYEIIEWWVALASGEDATAFLGTQGYIWDTQSDMWFALIGAVAGLVLLSNLHDRQLAKLKNNAPGVSNTQSQ